MTQSIFVHTLNMSKRLATAEGNQIGHIRLMVDANGLATEDEEAAVMATIEWENGGWSAVRLDDTAPVRLN
jgi:hypothetical protein